VQLAERVARVLEAIVEFAILEQHLDALERTQQRLGRAGWSSVNDVVDATHRERRRSRA